MATVEQPGMAAGYNQQAPVSNGGLLEPSPSGGMPPAHVFNLKAEIAKLSQYCKAKAKDPVFKYVSLLTSFIEKHSKWITFQSETQRLDSGDKGKQAPEENLWFQL